MDAQAYQALGHQIGWIVGGVGALVLVMFLGGAILKAIGLAGSRERRTRKYSDITG